MANSYSPVESILKTTGITVGASETNTVISQSVGLSAQGSRNVRVDFKVSSTTVATGITAKLQYRSIETWTDLAGANASVSITADGEYSLTQCIERSADQPNMPLKKQLRLVITTGVGDTVTVDTVRVQQGM